MSRLETNGEEEGFGCAEVLACSITKHLHGLKKVMDSFMPEIMEERLRVIGKVHADNASHPRYPDTQRWLSPEPAGQGFCNEQVQAGRERTALPYASLPSTWAGHGTIDHCHCCCVSEEEACPTHHVVICTMCCHKTEQERPADSVISFLDV